MKIKQLTAFFAFVVMGNFTFAQFTLNPTQNIAQLTSTLQGGGVQITNMVVTCHNCGIGTFTGGNATNLGINQGVVLSSGSIQTACPTALETGINTAATTLASYSANGPGDADINVISPSTLGSFDRCLLEFTLTPTGDTVEFEYVFGSEEYTNFVCSNFNDAFGFFVSGPNPAGGNYVKRNVALVPNTLTPVSIGTINGGVSQGAVQPCILTNTQYYVNNSTGLSIVYDGFTVRLIAKFATVPCQPYQIKLAIADVGDGALDSGVFLEAKSFSSGNFTIKTSTSIGNGFNTAIEGCANGIFRFVSDKISTAPQVINYAIGGTATNGVDYNNILSSVTIAPGDTVANVIVVPNIDGITEGSETIKLFLINPCTNLPYDSAVISILDTIQANATATDYFICAGETTTLQGTGGVTYQWAPAGSLVTPTAATTLASPTVTTTYSMTATVGGCIARDTVTINVSNPNFTLDAGPNQNICANQTIQFAPVLSQGSAPYTYLWTPPTYIAAGGTTQLSPNATPLQTTTYTLTVNSANGCSLSDTVRINVAGIGPPVVATANPTIICPGQPVQLNYTSNPISCGLNTVGCNGIDKTDSVGVGYNVQTGSPTSNVTIYGNYFRSTRMQILYTAAELNAVYGGGGTIKSLAWQIGTFNSNASLQDFTIRMKCVSPTVTALSAWETGLVQVYQAPLSNGVSLYTPVTGWNNHNLNTFYDWDGVSNLVIEICFFNPNTFNNFNNMMVFTTVNNSVIYSRANTNQCNINAAVTSTNQRPKLRLRLCQPDYAAFTTVWTPSTGTNAVSNPAIRNPTANPQTTQTYQVTVSQNGCPGSNFVTVNIDTSVKVNAGPDLSFCTGQQVQLTATPSGSPLPGNAFTYQWRNIQTNAIVGNSQTISVNPTTTTSYQVILTCGPCIIRDTVLLNVGALGITNLTTPITCFGANNGKIKINSTGLAPFSYTWSANASTANIDSAVNLGIGTYSVTVTDALSCSGTASFTLIQPSAVTFSNTSTNVSCNGGNNGTISVTASGGTGTLNYNWSNGLPNNANVTGLNVNTYTLTITDASNCSATGSFNITEPTALQLSVIQRKDVRCFNGNDGFITVLASGGTPGYTYTWSHNAGLNQTTASSLTANNYTATVTDLNGCSVSISNTITQPSSGVTFNPATINDALCFGAATGSATVNPTGGVTPYTYLWTPSGQTTATATGLSAQSYTVVVTDDSLCTATTTIIINQPAAIQIASVVTNVQCNGNSDGAINITINNGATPYGFAWSNLANTEDLLNVAANNYAVTVADANNCTQSANYTITEPTALTLNAPTITNVSCFVGNNGSITANPTGGTGAYTYTWNPTGSSQTVSNLTAGSYDVTISDANNCSITNSYSITEPATPLSISNSIVTDNLCFGQSLGTIDITVVGGTPSYTYAWSHNAQLNNNTAVNLAAAQYTVTITDFNGCTLSNSYTVTQPTAITFGSSTSSNVSCFGGNDGLATVSPTGGTGAYSYSWNGVVGTNPQTSLSANTYNVLVTDANNCTASTQVTITEPGALIVNPIIKNVDCFGGSNGDIDINPAGGNSPYQFLWSDGQTAQKAVQLSVGTYSCSVTDNTGCTVVGTATLTEPTELFFTTQASQVKCPGDKNGTITVTATGATPPYSYSANQDGSNFFFSTDGVIINLASGFYAVIVSDNNGCTKVDTVFVPAPVPDVYNITTDSTSCFGPDYNDGAIFINGLTPQNQPYQFSVDGSPLQFSGDFYNQSAGEHIVEGVNNFGCKTTLTAFVPEPANGFAEILPNDTTLQLGQSIQLNSTFGPFSSNAIVSYSWSPAEGLSCIDCPNPLVTSYARNTDYILTIVYNGLCQATATASISVENNLPLYIPTAFSPNGDGNNDVFQIYGQGIRTIDLKIFNRWGEKVFETTNQFEGWDGTYKGVMQNPSVYTYNVDVTFLDNKKVERKGTVSIIR